MATALEAAKTWVDAFNKKDLKALMALYADDCINTQPHLPAPLRGKQATEEDLGGFLRAFPNGQLRATSIVAQGDVVAMEWTFTGTQTAPLAGPTGTIPASNKKVSIAGAEFTRHDSRGLIVEEHGYFDLVSFMTQLGVMAPPQPA